MSNILTATEMIDLLWVHPGACSDLEIFCVKSECAAGIPFRYVCSAGGDMRIATRPEEEQSTPDDYYNWLLGAAQAQCDPRGFNIEPDFPFHFVGARVIASGFYWRRTCEGFIPHPLSKRYDTRLECCLAALEAHA